VSPVCNNNCLDREFIRLATIYTINKLIKWLKAKRLCVLLNIENKKNWFNFTPLYKMKYIKSSGLEYRLLK